MSSARGTAATRRQAFEGRQRATGGDGLLAEDQDVRELVFHPGLPLLVPHFVEDIEQDTDEGFEMLAVMDGLVGDRVELVVRCWALDFDRDDTVDDDVRP